MLHVDIELVYPTSIPILDPIQEDRAGVPPHQMRRRSCDTNESKIGAQTKAQMFFFSTHAFVYPLFQELLFWRLLKNMSTDVFCTPTASFNLSRRQEWCPSVWQFFMQSGSNEIEISSLTFVFIIMRRIRRGINEFGLLLLLFIRCFVQMRRAY